MDYNTPGSLSFTVSWSLLRFMFNESLSQWCYLTILSSATPFSFCIQSFPTSGSFPVNQLFVSGSQSIGASASAWVLPLNISPSFMIDWFDLTVQGTLKSLLQYHNLKASILWHSPSLWSHSYICTWLLAKKHSFDYMDLCWQSDAYF